MVPGYIRSERRRLARDNPAVVAAGIREFDVITSSLHGQAICCDGLNRLNSMTTDIEWIVIITQRHVAQHGDGKHATIFT